MGSNSLGIFMTDSTSDSRFRMRWACFIFMIGSCWAIVYNVGKKTNFYRFELTPRIKKITASTPTIKTRNCGSKDFCLEVYEGKRAAIVRGTVYENVSAVIFYGRQRKTPYALVIRTKAPPNQNKTAPKLPDRTKVRKTVEVDRGTDFDYLAIFDDDLEKIEVTGDVQVVTAGQDNSDLRVYSPLYVKGAEDAQFILVRGYIEQTKISKMKWLFFLFIFGTCLAKEYNVGEKTSFYRFELRPQIKQITASTPTIKTRNCGNGDFCLEVYGGKRAAIVRGTVYKNASAVIFYGSQRKSPRALVIRIKVQPNQNKTALQLPAGTKVGRTLEVSEGTDFDYLAIFDDDLECSLNVLLDQLALDKSAFLHQPIPDVSMVSAPQSA
nr:unnamed protein product [Spirometra erinaceieuropaei]